VRHGVARRLREVPGVDALGLPIYRGLARLTLRREGAPVFANSLPKAGTHVLAEALQSMPDLRFSGWHTDELDHPQGCSIEASRLGRAIRSVPGGQFMTGHHPYYFELASLLRRRGFRCIFVIRDPRDIVVSHALYVTYGDLRHPLHRRYTELYETDGERITASIEGFGASRYGPGLPSIGGRLALYSGWLCDPVCKTVRFEDLIGPRGGGEDSLQFATVDAIAGHIGRPLSGEGVRRVALRAWNPRSRTFREGRQGGWQARLDASHLEKLHEVAGPWLARYGYGADAC
jgi:sulfotransferase 6B1